MQQPLPLPASAAQLQAALAHSLALERSCAAEPAFLLQLGQLLNLARRYPEALERLEAALMARPGHPATMLEFALALAGSGDPHAAYLTLHALPATEATEATPPSAAELEHLRAALRRASAEQAAHLAALQGPSPNGAPAGGAPAPRRSLNLALGWDDNPNATPRQPQIELTLPSGPVWVQLQRQPEQAGPTLQADFEQSAALAPRWHYRIHASARATPASPTPPHSRHPTRLHWGATLAWAAPSYPEQPLLGGAPLQLEASYQGIALSGRAAHQQIGLAAYLGLNATHRAQPPHTPPPCAHTLGLEAQRRRYPQLPVLNGHYLGALWHAHCGAAGLQAQLRLGLDHPTQPQRPGGAQRSLGLRLSWQPSPSPPPSYRQPQPPGWFALADLAWLHDQRGYSPWLALGQPRTQQRVLLRLEYRWPHAWPARGWQPYAWADSFTQRSNLALFETQQHTLGLGLRRVW